MKQHRTPFIKVSWGLILLFVAGMAVLQAMPEKVVKGDSKDPTGLVMVQLQGEYLLGVASMLGSESEIATQASLLDIGTIGQRQRYMAFMIALGEPELAKQSALRMYVELDEQKMELTGQQAKNQETIDQLADGVLLPSDSESLKDSLGWFGKLVEADEQQREIMESSSARKVFIVGGIMLGIAFAATLGLVGLIILLVKTFCGSLNSGLVSGVPQHGIYAEVFALWLIYFIVLMSVAGILSKTFAEDNATLAMGLSLLAFFTSLTVLFWARVRGISWNQIRTDIGWTRGGGFFKETLWGFAGYAMMLPILGIGVILVLILVLIQTLFTGGIGSDPFAGTSGGAHPIVLDIANGGWQVRILLVLLAAVAAPIIEETMFRGVLYRHLRTSTNKWGIALSIVGSVLITSALDRTLGQKSNLFPPLL